MATRKATEAKLVTSNGHSKSDKSPKTDVKFVATDATNPKPASSRQCGCHGGLVNKKSKAASSLPQETVKREPGGPRKRDQSGEHKLPPPLLAKAKSPSNSSRAKPGRRVIQDPDRSYLSRLPEDGGEVFNLPEIDNLYGLDEDSVLAHLRGVRYDPWND